MRKPSLGHVAAILLGVLALPGAAFGTVTDTVNAGYLYSTPYTGSSPTATPGKIPNGALLLLIAAGGNNGTTFTDTPPAGQFVAGGDTILGAAAYNYNLSTGGGSGSAGTATESTFTNLISAPAGKTVYIELRWYPNIAYSNYSPSNGPAAGSSFGAYNPLYPGTNASGNTSLNPDNGATWAEQADGTYTMNFYTSDFTTAPSHTQAVSEGYANFLVPSAAVPEPSAGVLGGLTLVILVGAGRLCSRLRGF